MSVTVEEPFYHRKLDRSPEDAAFHTLPPADKQLISQIRSAMDGTRDKMTRLRDDIEDKERDITRESALRKAAEARLDQLVDMYGNPAVNEELRQRLPRAGKDDVRVKWEKELEEGARRSPELVEGDSKSGRGKKKHNKGAASSGGRRRRRGRGGSGGSDIDSESDEEERASRWHSGFFPPYPGTYGGYPSPPFPGYMPMPPMFPMMYPSQAANPNSNGIPVAQSTQAPVAMQPVMMMSPSNIPANQGAAAAAVSTNGATETGQAAASPGGLAASNSNLSKSTPDLHAASPKETNVCREHNRQISKLLAELDAARDLNRKLQDELYGERRELDSLKITLQTKDAATEAEIAGKAAALVEEIYRAQQQRDKAMMGRLRLANESRDEALLKLRNLETSGEGYEADTEDLPRDKKLQELLSELDLSNADNKEWSQQARDILNNITSTQQRRKQLANEEMRAVMQERDAAVAKNKQMEADFLRLQRQTRNQGPDKQQQAAVQAKLLATQQERELALSKVRKLEEELQTLRVYYSLHKSLSQEANLRDQFNNTLHTYEGQLHLRDNVVDAAQKENNRLVSQLQMLADEKDLMVTDMEKAQHGRKEAQANCEKLERLVNVLRRKINGLGSKDED